MSSAPPPPLPLVEGRAPGCRGPPGKVGGGTAADAVLGAGSAKLMDLWGVGRLSTGHCCHPTLSLSLSSSAIYRSISFWFPGGR